MEEKIKDIYENINEYLCIYTNGEISFIELFEKVEPFYNKLCYIRYQEIIDKLIDVKDIAKEDKNDN